MSKYYRFIVSGRVQGVFYRAWVQKKAIQLNLTGWARNLHGGEVEIVARGDKEGLSQFEKSLWQGSTFAKVKNVSSESITDYSNDLIGFKIRQDG